MFGGFPDRVIILEGNLDKWCRKLARWKTKYVLLETRRGVYLLSYFKVDPTNSNTTNTNNKSTNYKTEKNLILKDIKIYDGLNNSRVFKIKLCTNSRIYKFRAYSENKKKEWLHMIMKSCHHYTISKSATTIDSSMINDSKQNNIYQQCNDNVYTSQDILNDIKYMVNFKKNSSYNINPKRLKRDSIPIGLIKHKRSLFDVDKSTTTYDFGRLNRPPLVWSGGRLSITNSNNTTSSELLSHSNSNHTICNEIMLHFNNVDYISKRLKHIKTILNYTLSMYNRQGVVNQPISTEDDNTTTTDYYSSTGNTFIFINTINQLQNYIKDIFHKYQEIIQLSNISDYINNLSNDLVYTLDNNFFIIPTISSYSLFFNQLGSVACNHDNFKYSYLPITTLLPRPLTEVISSIFGMPYYFLKLINSNDSISRITNFTKYICGCFNRLLTNKSYFMGFPITPMYNEHFMCYYTHNKNDNIFKMYVTVKCISLKPLKFLIQATDNQNRIDFELILCLNVKYLMNKNFILDICCDGVLSLYNPEEFYFLQLPNLTFMYKYDGIYIDMSEEIIISSENDDYKSFIYFDDFGFPQDNTAINEITTISLISEENMNNNTTTITAATITTSNSNSNSNNNSHFQLTSIGLFNLDRSLFTNFILKMDYFGKIFITLWLIIIKFIYDLISYDNHNIEDNNNDNNNNNTCINSNDTQNMDNIECNIDVKSFLSCEIITPMITNSLCEPMEPNIIRMSCPMKELPMDGDHIGKSNISSTNTTTTTTTTCYVMESTTPEIEKYSSRSIWKNILEFIKNGDHQNYQQELNNLRGMYKSLNK